MGRPSKFEKIDLREIKHYAPKGYTDSELAKIFKVTRQTVCNWKNEYPEFFDTLKKGKLIADAKVEASLYQRACGYSHPEIHISNYQGKISITPIIKHYPPDPTSMIFWLKNRQSNKWRDKREIVGGSDETRIVIINNNKDISEAVMPDDHRDKVSLNS